MEKNVFLLTMSTLNFSPGKENKELKGYYYSYEGREPMMCYSQLEPISRMLIETGKRPDRIIVLCTKDTIKNWDFFVEQTPHCCSAYDFYIERIKRVLPNCGDDVFCPIDIDPMNIYSGIRTAAEKIKKESVDCSSIDEFRLWVDTQGGFRDSSLVMSAITNLLNIRGISIAGVYSIEFTKEKAVNIETPALIKEQSQNYKIFDFVAGMREFILYGQGAQLARYYDAIDASEETRQVITSIKNLAESIQMCDPAGFETRLKELSHSILEYQKSEQAANELFSIFIDEVVEDYGVLLKDECRRLDAVAWCLKKHFYQQALTFIEARIPDEIMEKKILDYNCVLKDQIFKLKSLAKLGHKTEAGYVTLWYCKKKSKKCANLRRWIDMGRNGKTELENLEQLAGKAIYNLKENENYCFQIIENNNGEEIKIGISMSTKCYSAKKLQQFLYLFKMLKNERNNINHFSTKEGRASLKEIDHAIRLFLELGRELYREVENQP